MAASLGHVRSILGSQGCLFEVARNNEQLGVASEIASAVVLLVQNHSCAAWRVNETLEKTHAVCIVDFLIKNSVVSTSITQICNDAYIKYLAVMIKHLLLKKKMDKPNGELRARIFMAWCVAST